MGSLGGVRGGRARAFAALVGWCAALAAGLLLFHALGDGPLEAPPLDPSAWADWADGREPLVATVAVLRLLALALSWYLVGVTTIGIVARLARAARWVAVADALTVPMVRRMLQAALGLSLATAVVTASVPSGAHRVEAPSDGAVTPAESVVPPEDAVDDPPTLRRVVTTPDGAVASGDAVPGDAVPTLRRVADPGVDGSKAGDSDVPTLRRVPDDGPRRTGSDATELPSGVPLPLHLADPDRSAGGHDPTATSGDPDADDDAEVADEQAGQAAADPTAADDDGVVIHEVVGGDSLWRIADRALADAWDRTPDDAEVVGYWREVIEHNRDTLVDPDNPDLILPGQVLELPPIPRDGLVR